MSAHELRRLAGDLDHVRRVTPLPAGRRDSLQAAAEHLRQSADRADVRAGAPAPLDAYLSAFEAASREFEGAGL